MDQSVKRFGVVRVRVVRCIIMLDKWESTPFKYFFLRNWSPDFQKWRCGAGERSLAAAAEAGGIWGRSAWPASAMNLRKRDGAVKQ